MRILTILLFVSCLHGAGKAQQYEQALGLRGGIGATATYKQFLSYRSAFEVIGGRYDNDFWGVGLLLQFHNEFRTSSAFEWYWGFGPTLTFQNSDGFLGISGALGLHVTLQDIPLNFSLDWLPRIRLGSQSTFRPSGGGIAVRYVIAY